MNEREERIASDIEEAVKEYEALLWEQVERNDRMLARTAEAKAHSGKRIIGLCPGDGIGPVLMREVHRVLDVLLKEELTSGAVEFRNIEGFTLEERLAAGKTVPDDVLEQMKGCDCLLKGPTTTPNASMGVTDFESANVFLRKAFDLYANVRPVKIPEKGIDWVFFRENTEGEYALGSRGAAIGDALRVDYKVTTYGGTERIARAAFEYAERTGLRRVSVVTKANIMKKTDGSFLRLAKKIAEEYPDVETDSWFVDIMAANLVNEELRKDFHVFLLPNLYGDILTDEAAQIQGGVGTAGSANLGDDYAIFEAIHGSAPRMVEEGIEEHANPASLLQAASMMLTHERFAEKGRQLEEAIAAADAKLGSAMTGTADGGTCTEFADEVLRGLEVL